MFAYLLIWSLIMQLISKYGYTKHDQKQLNLAKKYMC